MVQLGRDYLSNLYSTKLNRGMTDKDYTDWNQWYQDRGGQMGTTEFEQIFSEAVKPELERNKLTPEYITDKYNKELDRDPTEQEILDWQTHATDIDVQTTEQFDDMFKDSAVDEKEDTSYTKIEDWINQLYEQAYPEMVSGLKSEASKRGGLESGGFMTSMAKGKATSDAAKWQQLLGLEQSKLARSQTLADQKTQRGYELEDWEKNYGLSKEMAETGKTPDWAYWLQPLASLGGSYLGSKGNNMWKDLIK